MLPFGEYLHNESIKLFKRGLGLLVSGLVVPKRA